MSPPGRHQPRAGVGSPGFPQPSGGGGSAGGARFRGRGGGASGLGGAAGSTRGRSRHLLLSLPGRALPGGRGGGRRAACSGNVPLAACGAAGGASRSGLWVRAVRLYPPELAVRTPGGDPLGPRGLPPGRCGLVRRYFGRALSGSEEGGSLKPGSFSPRASGGGGSPGLGLRVWRAGLPPAVDAGSMWRPGGGDWAGAVVSQWLGPTAALNVLCTKIPFGAAPRDGRGAHRGLSRRLLTLAV